MGTRRRGCLLVVVVIAVVATLLGWRWWRAPRPLRFPDYALDVRLPAAGAAAPGPLRVGAGTVDVTPDVQAGAVWMAGFHQGRRATAVHDPLLARALVLDDGRSRIAIVALDLIGLFHDEVVLVRRALPPALGIDYLAVCSLHNHEGPDTMGLWGAGPLRSGVAPAYLARVRDACVDAVRQGVSALAPARLVAAEADVAADGLIRDSRPPEVIDARLLALRFEAAGAAGAGAPMATLVLWSNHPEALGDSNHAISSDFPHFVRRAVERDGGGTCVYLSGSVGGLMTPLGLAVRAPDGRKLEGDTLEKAEALGEALARRAGEALAGPGARRTEAAPLGVRARLVDIPAENPIFWAGMKLGVVDRGLVGPARAGARVRTEVGALRIGPVTLALVPGELYPEIAVGGVESPAGADFPGEPAERPPLRELLAASVPGSPAPPLAGIVGLANDELGYIVPRTQWDAAAPFTYGQARAPYGEINSVGPDAAPALHAALAEVIADLPR